MLYFCEIVITSNIPTNYQMVFFILFCCCLAAFVKIYTKAETIRQEVIISHIKKQGSQNSLRLQIKEILGESNLVSSETLSLAIEKADQLIKVDPYDKRHFLYENFKVLFYAMRQLEPHQIDDYLWQEINHASDLLLSAVLAAQNRDKPQKVTLNSFTI